MVELGGVVAGSGVVAAGGGWDVDFFVHNFLMTGLVISLGWTRSGAQVSLGKRVQTRSDLRVGCDT